MELHVITSILKSSNFLKLRKRKVHAWVEFVNVPLLKVIFLVYGKNNELETYLLSKHLLWKKDERERRENIQGHINKMWESPLKTSSAHNRWTKKREKAKRQREITKLQKSKLNGKRKNLLEKKIWKIGSNLDLKSWVARNLKKLWKHCQVFFELVF